MEYLSFYKETTIKLLACEEFRETHQSGMYLISNYGRVYSIAANKLLVAGLGGDSPYYNVSLHGKTYTIHRLVLQAFNQDDYFDYAVADHIDGNQLNNHLSNLQWLTNSQNQLKANRVAKVDYKAIGIKVGNTMQKLSSSEVLEIQRIMDKLPPDNLACLPYRQERATLGKSLTIKYGISISVVNRIAARAGRYNDTI